MSTDLERFLATDGRTDAVQRVRAEIDAKGISYIYYQFVSVTGRIMGKGAPRSAAGARWRFTESKPRIITRHKPCDGSGRLRPLSTLPPGR